MANLEGLIVATPTPFDESAGIDFDYVVRHLDYLRERGVDGVVPSGTNGEGSSMSSEERRELMRVVLEYKGGMFVIPGTGCASVPETIELTRAAERLGADAALVTPPFFFKNVAVEGVYNFYAAVLRSTDLPILLYNIPHLSGVEIADEVVERLMEFPNLLGIKDSSCDLFRTMRYRAHFPGLSIYVGADVLIESTARIGVAGVLSGIANVFPELIHETMRLCAAGHGREMQAKVVRVAEVFARYPLFASNKYALTFKGFPPTLVRPPLVDLSEEQKSALAASLRAEGLV